MKHSIQEMKRYVRRRLQRVVQKARDGNYRRRANALLLLYDGNSQRGVSRTLHVSRTTLRKWVRGYEAYGEAGLVPAAPGTPPTTVDDTVCGYLLELVGHSPEGYGFHRTRWSSEMLAMQIEEDLGVAIHASTVRRLLPRLGLRWNRARPTLCIADPLKGRKMRAIRRALKANNPETPVFYLDEADIDLNPKIGHAWMPQGQQTTIPTPGKNQKRYLAGALHAQTGKLVWVEAEKKNAFLFIRLLAALRKTYRQAKRLLIILDNFVIHKSRIAQCFLSYNPKFQLLFQPVYHPWVNHIERLWKQLHDNITRNHRCSTMNQLMEKVRHFMNNISPFTHIHYALLKA
jgi:transposase